MKKTFESGINLVEEMFAIAKSKCGGQFSHEFVKCLMKDASFAANIERGGHFYWHVRELDTFVYFEKLNYRGDVYEIYYNGTLYSIEKK